MEVHQASFVMHPSLLPKADSQRKLWRCIKLHLSCTLRCYQKRIPNANYGGASSFICHAPFVVTKSGFPTQTMEVHQASFVMHPSLLPKAKSQRKLWRCIKLHLSCTLRCYQKRNPNANYGGASSFICHAPFVVTKSEIPTQTME